MTSGYGDKSMSCHYRQHDQCGVDWPGGEGCYCLCHTNHCCRDCGRILGQGAPWQRCVPCDRDHRLRVTLRSQQRRIEADLEEPMLIEAVDVHRRIMALIG